MGGGRLLAPKVAPRRKIEKKKRIYKAQYTTYYEKNRRKRKQRELLREKPIDLRPKK